MELARCPDDVPTGPGVDVVSLPLVEMFGAKNRLLPDSRKISKWAATSWRSRASSNFSMRSCREHELEHTSRNGGRLCSLVLGF